MPQPGGNAAGLGFTRAELESAVARQQLVLHYQPIINTAAGRTVGYEALVRWDHPQHGLIFPDMFIPAAEESGAIVAIGRWVLHAAAAQLSLWQANAGSAHSLFVAVNLSAQQFTPKYALLEDVQQVLAATGLRAHNLVLEITERRPIAMESALGVVRGVRQVGVRLALDDFGKGHGTLENLEVLPVDIVKADKLFFRQATVDVKQLVRLRTFVVKARRLGMQVIVEGIESLADELLVKNLRCWGQGYYLGPPRAARQVPP